MPSDRPHHLHSLDVARGVAAFAVVFWHWQQFFYVGLDQDAGFRSDLQPLFRVFRPFYLHGHEAVSLFFSLSGFIFFWLFAHEISAGSLTLRTFFLRRFSRLYPLHFVTLVVVAVAQPIYRVLHGSFFVYAWNNPPHFVLQMLMLSTIGRDTGLSFNGPSWSVSLEMILYAIFFLSCAMLKARWLPMSLIAVSGYLILGQCRPSFGSAVGAFFIGGCLSLLYTAITSNPKRGRHLILLMICALATCIALVSVFGTPTEIVQGVVRPGDAPDVLTVVIFPCCILTLALAEFRWPAVFARVARATRLGELSYSVYLIHFPLQLVVMILLGRLGIDARIFYSPLSLVAFFTILIGLGLLSHYRFEMPMQLWLRKRRGATRGG